MDKKNVENAIMAVRSGDANAYAVVVNAYQRRLRASVAGRCPPGVDPNEIAHVAFIEAYKKIDQYKLGTDFYVWLWVFARNTLLAYIQKTRRIRQNREKYVDRLATDQLERQLQSGAPIEDSQVEALQTCMQKLPEEARKLLSVRYDSKVTLKALSSLWGRSVAALKFELYSIRKGLKDCVQRTLAGV